MGNAVTVEDAEKLDTYEADGRGRVTLGKEYAGKELRIAFAVDED